MKRFVKPSLFHYLIYKWREQRGEVGDEWRTSLPESVREWDEAKNSTTADDFWKQIGDHRAHLGQSIRIPGPDAGEADWQQFNTKMLAKVPTLMPKPNLEDPEQAKAFFNAIGRPAEPTAYKVPEVDAKGVKLDNSRIEAFREIAHQAGLTDGQFQHIVKVMSEKNIAEALEAQEAADTNAAALKTSWGAAYDDNYLAVTRFLEDTKAPKAILEMAQNRQLDAGMADWFLAQRKAVMGEGSNLSKDVSLRGALTPSEAQLRIREIQNNSKHPYNVISDPGHADALKEMVKLQMQARGKNA